MLLDILLKKALIFMPLTITAWTPIQIATETGCQHVVSFLLQVGGNIGIKSTSGDSLLHQICKCPSVGRLKFVRHQSCGVHDHTRVGSPPWKPVCEHQSHGTLEYLLSKSQGNQ